MSRVEAWLVYAATLLVGVTGIVYAVMRYLLEPAPFAVVGHPWQPSVQRLHLLVAPLLVFAVGVIWRRHVWTSWRSGLPARRRSGVGLVLMLVPMVVSGYLIQAAVGEGWRQAWIVVHNVTSGLWLATLVVHRLVPANGSARAMAGAVAAVLVVGLAVAAARGEEVGQGRGAARGEEPARSAEVERRLVLMGTEAVIRVEADDRQSALRGAEGAARALEAADRRLSTWRQGTELARLNRAPPGERVLLSPELAAELRAARHWWLETGGAFDPGIGALAEAWGLRTGGRLPSDGERRAAVASGGMAALDLDGRLAHRRSAGLRLDEGAFGKGAALDDAARALGATSGFIAGTLDLGGQVLVAGDARPRRLAIADPRRRARAALALLLAGGSAATSGNSEHGILAGGLARGHLLDPRSGLPAPDFGSLTVVAPTALAADCLSTGLYVMGPEAALAWAAERPGIDVLVLEPGEDALRARATAGLAGRLAPLEDRVRIEIWRGGTRAEGREGKREEEREEEREAPSDLAGSGP